MQNGGAKNKRGRGAGKKRGRPSAPAKKPPRVTAKKRGRRRAPAKKRKTEKKNKSIIPKEKVSGISIESHTSEFHYNSPDKSFHSIKSSPTKIKLYNKHVPEKMTVDKDKNTDNIIDIKYI